MQAGFVSLVLSGGGALVGGFIGAGITVWAERNRNKMERAKLVSSVAFSPEIEKVRIQKYAELWTCLDGISTFRPNEMVERLPGVQQKLQEWYYLKAGGLTIVDIADTGRSTKWAFFAARDLVSNSPKEIWNVFHELRRCIRRDLRIFQDEKEEKASISKAMKKLGS